MNGDRRSDIKNYCKKFSFSIKKSFFWSYKKISEVFVFNLVAHYFCSSLFLVSSLSNDYS